MAWSLTPLQISDPSVRPSCAALSIGCQLLLLCFPGEVLHLEDGADLDLDAASEGAFFSQATASSIDLTCQIQKPATISLDSVNGPSMTVGVPKNFTRLA
jgi:hypothetical protein